MSEWQPKAQAEANGCPAVGKDKPCPHCDAPPGHWHSFSCPVREQPAPGVDLPHGGKR